jgi:hypothetical protein
MAKKSLGLGCAAAAWLLAIAPAAAVSDQQTVTIESGKHNKQAPVIKQLPPSAIPQIKSPDDNIPLQANTSQVSRPGLHGTAGGGFTGTHAGSVPDLRNATSPGQQGGSGG